VGHGSVIRSLAPAQPRGDTAWALAAEAPTVAPRTDQMSTTTILH